jgi:outer membrane protein assembly factor BamB
VGNGLRVQARRVVLQQVAPVYQQASGPQKQAINGMAYVDYAELNVNGASGDTNALYALDGQTGHQVWTTQTAYSDPTIANGEVFTLVMGTCLLSMCHKLNRIMR